MAEVKELLREKEKEFNGIQAPDCLEMKLRDALEGRKMKQRKLWKISAVAASIVIVIGFGYLNIMNNSNHLNNGNFTQADVTRAEVADVVKRMAGLKTMVGDEKGGNESGFTYGTEKSDADFDSYQDSQAVSRQSTAQSQNSEQLQSDTGKKVIKNADATIEAVTAEDAFNRISNWVNSHGGYEFSRSITDEGTHKRVEANFRVAPDQLPFMLEYLKSVGKVVNSRTSSTDITDQYYDSAARLVSLKASRDQLMEVMKKAVTVEDILKVQGELNKITSDIEALQGKINVWDKLLAESSVNLLIYEEKDPLRTSAKVNWNFSSPGTVMESMKNSFINSVNTLMHAGVWLLVFLASALPIILLGGIVGVFIWRMKRKKISKTGK